jgi:hypothetical protein
MIYGYSRAAVNEYGLLEMNEVTFAMDPGRLRVVGQFLIDMADEMEKGTFEKCSHRHLTSTHPDWDKLQRVADVIVSPPPKSAIE